MAKKINKPTKDEIRDIAIRIVDTLVKQGYVKNCIDTDDEDEFEVQDIINSEIKKSLKKLEL